MIKNLRLRWLFLKKVKHPNVANLHEVFETTRRLYLVLDLINGGELFDKIVALDFYSEEDARLLTKNLLTVIQHLHSNKVIHRDLKPENLLIASKNGPITDIKVTDFGLATIFDGKSKIEGCVGTPGYMAPEVVRAVGYSEKVDLWSIGVILYILLCGYPPFEDSDLTFSYKFFSPEWDNISENAKDLIRKLLTIDPAKRLSASESLQHPFILNSVSNPSHMNNTQASMKRFQARKKLKKGILAVASMTRMKHMMQMTKKKEEEKKEELKGELKGELKEELKEEIKPEPEEEKETQETKERRLIEFVDTIDKILNQSISLIQTVSDSAEEIFSSTDSHPPEYHDGVERMFKNLQILDGELNLLKGAYLKTVMKDKDLSKYFVSTPHHHHEKK